MTTTRDVLVAAIPPRRLLVTALAWGTLSAVAAVALLALSGWLIVSADLVDSLIYLNVAIVGVRLFAVSRATLRYLERYSSHDAAFRHLARTRAAVTRRLIPWAPGTFARTDTLLTTVVDDIDELQNLALRVIQPIVIGISVAFGAVVVTTIIAPFAGLTLLGCLALAAAAALWFGWLAGARAEREIADRRADVAAAVNDFVRGFDLHTAYGTIADAHTSVTKADNRLQSVLLRATTGQGVSLALVSWCAGLASIAAIPVGLAAAPSDAFDPAWFAVTVLIPMAVFEVFATVPAAASAWRLVVASARRIAAVVPDTLPPQIVADDSTLPAPTTTALALTDASIAWPNAAPHLTNVNLTVASGERLLITGSSGAGKSTLAYALTRFLAVTGRYTIGGHDANALSPQAVRERIGLCEQKPYLFDESIRHNLSFARDTATDDELYVVLERVGLAEWARTRGGLDARVGERGALVSGGQAQRIALARALLRGFDVLILDEPTAGVDGDTSDALLADLLAAVTPSQSVVLISHVAPPAHLIDRALRISDGTLHSLMP